MLMQIPALNAVMRSSGAEYLGISKSGEIAIMKAGDWSEDKHPRADNGQFGSGGGKPKGKESAGAKHKRTAQARRAEGAGQSTLGGGKAIQTLLGGGSALDKIGWLNTSKPKEPEAAKEPEKAPERKPEAPTKPPAANVKSAKDTIRENLKSGKLKKETVIAAVRSLYEQANEAESKGDDATAKKLDQQAEVMTDAAEIKGELYSQGILQIRGRPSHIGPGIPARQSSTPKKPTGTKTPSTPNNSYTSQRVDAYRDKVISHGKKLDSIKNGDQTLDLYEHNGRTYTVDHDMFGQPSQFGRTSQDEWRRIKDELTGDEEPHPTPAAQPNHKPAAPVANNPHVTQASSSDILTQGKKLDEHKGKSLHEYNGGLYMVTRGKPTGLKISRTAWESMKYD